MLRRRLRRLALLRRGGRGVTSLGVVLTSVAMIPTSLVLVLRAGRNVTSLVVLL